MKFLIGKFEGETKTFMGPNVPPQKGTMLVEFQEILDGLFVEQNYTGTLEDKAHAGKCIFGIDERTKEATAYWMDTFHTGGTALSFRGPLKDNEISVNGKWFAGDQEWGWRIWFKAKDKNILEMKHFIITPAGEEALGIEATLVRKV